jgi:hypothetical protein
MTPLRRFAASPQGDPACGLAKPVPRRALNDNPSTDCTQEIP